MVERSYQLRLIARQIVPNYLKELYCLRLTALTTEYPANGSSPLPPTAKKRNMVKPHGSLCTS